MTETVIFGLRLIGTRKIGTAEEICKFSFNKSNENCFC